MHEMDVQCSIELEWNSADRSGNIIVAAARSVGYAALGAMDNSGGDPTPETLLMAAISSSYSIALANALRAARLPQTRVWVRGSGTIGSNYGKTQFIRVVMSPTIQGADPLRRDAYESAATAARDDCVVGRSIRGNVAYVVDEVVLARSAESAGTDKVELP
jgi:organic hydroperoxide reductase OsmC/OhrA